MIKAVIFDMDGLLIDSEPVWFRARTEFLKEAGLTWTWEHQKNSMGISTKAWVEYIYNFANQKLSKEEVLDGIVSRMKQYYANGEIDIMPGANEALNYSKENFKVGLASGSYKELLYSAVKLNNWEKTFDEILSGDDIERGKPEPDIYLNVMERLGVMPSESIVLEDSRDGIKAGVAACANVIAVPGRDIPVPQEVLDSAFAVINTLNDFPKIVNKLNS
ncbi:MAG: HAD family phosphatase [Melioribacteraceae bacterium]|nr:HAD family phosphatase [Melioribacteraceae bacterium]